MRDPYRILQVAPYAEIEVIEAAYRRLARKYHPDTDPSPGATQRMQEINWAYEILKDPVRRAQYDRSSKTWSAARPEQSRQSPSTEAPRTTSSTPKTKTKPAASPHVESAPQPSFIRRNWFWIVLAVAALYFAYRPEPSNDLGSTNSTGSQSIASQSDQYADCISWTQAENFDGERKCVVGRIAIVTHEFDTISASDIWTAHFSFNDARDLRLISVNRDILIWEGQCVAVYGTLSERDDIREYVDDPQPSMVDADPHDSRGFSIKAAPPNICG